MKILVTGANGYIGGSVAAHLAQRGHNVDGLVRNAEVANAMRLMGIRPVMGNLNHIEAMRKILRSYDTIINCADSDNVGFVVLAIETLKGTSKTFIHTSGSSIVSERGEGKFVPRLHSEQDFSYRPEKAARVQIDRMILEASQNGMRTIVVCPSMIYGEGIGIKKTSIQIPLLESAAKELGRAVYIGEGENVWSNVHIRDLVEFYELVLLSNVSGEFFFVENGAASFKEISAAINQRIASNHPPESIGIDQGIDRWGAGAALFALASNSQVSAEKAKTQLNWRPQFNSLIREIKEGR